MPVDKPADPKQYESHKPMTCRMCAKLEKQLADCEGELRWACVHCEKWWDKYLVALGERDAANEEIKHLKALLDGNDG